MTTSINWPDYLDAITDGAPGSHIAKRAGVPESTISRWKSGDANPQPRQVVAVARAYDIPPVQALVVTGYLDAEEFPVVMPRQLQLREFSELELAREIVRRIEDGELVADGPLERPTSDRANVTRLRQTVPTEEEALDEDAAAKTEVIEIDEFGPDL